ncbi:helix-turn-helix transcriptional regulator [Yangia mangrovi]|uniref:AraC family transcriptional regulator n=1 Tax=Alloyangia mangrovi TaxID=1779329 RepID=A0A2A3JWN6_9RHOB|nr:AraC family transcriptional regulator [Alloyangia mangrovi]MCA0940575.1 AraC family transcriptional regulator [Alloyangia pacifica]MCA0945922.1 AraC family transcriptional regulator [Alloyangia pacifica]MCT4372587.1 helix-turn-helix transcriptional regulator [Alloyangia mangrovi]
MMKTFPLRPAAHHGITAHEIRSPLAETTYGLRAENACLLVLRSGRGRVLSGERDMGLEAPRFVWLAPGRDGTLKLSPGSRGELVLLTKGALARVLPGSAFGDELSQVLSADLSVPLGDERERVVRRLAELREELAESAPGVEIMAGHMLSMLLVQLWRGVKEGRARPDVATGGLVQGFVQLAGLHLREHWEVGDYARALGVSRDRLAGAVRRATGRSPQTWLHEALHREAAELLTNSGLQVAQVGFRLGFSDPAYFNRFFKRMEGVPPSRFRRRMAKRSAPATSYAAWP